MLERMNDINEEGLSLAQVSTNREIETKILHLLGIYPIVSPTMLQGALGPSLKPKIWRPVLQKMKKEGKIVETKVDGETPTGRYNAYTKIQLPGVIVTMPSMEVADGE